MDQAVCSVLAHRGGGRRHTSLVHRRCPRASQLTMGSSVFGRLGDAHRASYRFVGIRPFVERVDQRRADDVVFLPGRLGTQTRTGPGRVEQPPHGGAFHCSGAGRYGGARSTLSAAAVGPSRRGRLGHGHGNRHCLRHRGPGAPGLAHPAKPASLYAVVGDRRRHRRHSCRGHRLQQPHCLGCARLGCLWRCGCARIDAGGRQKHGDISSGGCLHLVCSGCLRDPRHNHRRDTRIADPGTQMGQRRTLVCHLRQGRRASVQS